MINETLDITEFQMFDGRLKFDIKYFHTPMVCSGKRFDSHVWRISVSGRIDNLYYEEHGSGSTFEEARDEAINAIKWSIEHGTGQTYDDFALRNHNW